MTDAAAADQAPPWTTAAGAALALHLAVIAAAMVTLKPSPPRQPSTAAFQVTMAPAPPTDVAPGVVHNEATPTPAPRPQVKLPFTPPPESSAATAIQLPKPVDRPAPPTPAPGAGPAAVAATRPAAAPVAAQPATRVTVSGEASDSWQARLLAQLERDKRYPAKARYFHQQDTVYVEFTMDRQGKVLSSKIVKSAGYPDIDAEVLALLKRAQPLVPPPADVPGETLTRTVAIEFYLS